jgi:hypothetical protein
LPFDWDEKQFFWQPSWTSTREKRFNSVRRGFGDSRVTENGIFSISGAHKIIQMLGVKQRHQAISVMVEHKQAAASEGFHRRENRRNSNSRAVLINVLLDRRQDIHNRVGEDIKAIKAF